MSWVDRQVTLYRSVRDTEGMPITAGEWLCMPYKMRPEVRSYLGKTPEELRAMVDAVRAVDKTTDKARYDALKKQLPACAFGGIFVGGRKADNITHRSRLVVLDIDKQDNPDKTPEDVCSVLQQSPEIVYAGKSVGGAGIWAIVQVSTHHHKAHCLHLIESFKRRGINLDTQCVDLPRTRLFSYDDNPAIFNREGMEYAGLYVSTQRVVRTQHNPVSRIPGDRQGDVCKLLDKALQQRANICPDYGDWFRLAGALHELGEVGRSYFHALSAIDPRYNERETQRKWDGCNTMGRVGIGTIFDMCRRAGVVLYDTPRQYTQRATPKRTWATPPPMRAVARPTKLQLLANINARTQGAVLGLISDFDCVLVDGGNVIAHDELVSALRAG